MTKYDALSRALEIILVMKRVVSEWTRGELPAPGEGARFGTLEETAEKIREMMRDARSGDGKSPKCAEQKVEDSESKQITDLLSICDEAQARAKKLMSIMEENPGRWPRDAWEDIAQVEGYMADAQHCLMDAADLYM